MRKSGYTTGKVVIVGGGVAGALTAYHLLQQGVVARVTVIDRRPNLGLGLAYSTPSLCHLLNVPAGKISVLPSQPSHFWEWLRTNHDSAATPDTYAPRAVFGRYIRELISGMQGIEHLQAEAIDLQRQDDAMLVTLKDGRTLEASHVVIATGNFEPAVLPGVEREAIARGLYCNNAWSQSTYAGLDANAPVALVGTGLTAVDVVLRLRQLGHRGPITAASRHGVFPHRHAPYTPAMQSAVPAGTSATCVAYLRVFRTVVRAGLEWRAAVDSLRAITNDLWLALPLEEQKRFRRHLQRRWDVVRHRMAPRIADLIQAELDAGTLKIRKGSVVGVTANQQGAALDLDTVEGHQAIQAARVINCTGPSTNYRRAGSQFLENLFRRGLAAPGPHGGGLDTTSAGALIDGQGNESDRLFNLGPGRLDTLIESIAIPEIREQAVGIATILTEKLAVRNGAVAFSPSAQQTAEVIA